MGGGARGGPFLGSFPPQDLLAALLSLYIHPDIWISRYISIYGRVYAWIDVCWYACMGGGARGGPFLGSFHADFTVP